MALATEKRKLRVTATAVTRADFVLARSAKRSPKEDGARSAKSEERKGRRKGRRKGKYISNNIRRMYKYTYK